jgi:hypothetical protein
VAGLRSLYAAAGRELDGIAAASPAETRRSRRARTALLSSLARYYRMMVCGHFFLSQNNSMLMNQLNCVTWLHLGTCTPHYTLDVLAMLLSEAEFARLYRSVIEDTLA